jgi:hypothetical protein
MSHPPLVTAPPQTDNVWDVDCTDFFPADKVTSVNVHGAYFYTPDTIELIREILRGIDRGVLEKSGATRPATPVPPSSGPASTGSAVAPGNST